MKNKRKFLFLAVILAVLMAFSCDSGGGDNEDVFGGGDIIFGGGNSHAALTNMKIGWNLGNSMDAWSGSGGAINPSETVWGNAATTQALINAVKAQGFDTVRIPVTWGSKIGAAPAYTLDSAWLNRVAEIVGYVNNAGMNAIINIHHDGADSEHWLSVRRDALTTEGKALVNAKFSAVWKQIAEKFEDTGSFLIFEGFNELHDGGWGYTGYNVPAVGSTAAYTNTSSDITNQRNRVNELNQLFVNTVRAVGGENANRYLLVNGLVTRPSETYASYFTLPTDTASNKLMVSIHFYDPYDFSGSASQATWGNKALPGNWANENNVQNNLGSIKTRFIDKGIPVIMGEYGAVRRNTPEGRAYRLYYLEYITKYAADCGIVPVYWDNGSSGSGSEGFGLFNRSSGALLSDAADVISVIMKAAKQTYNISTITAP
uniref:Cellulase n=1 Tax=uncultured bacterium contig00010 TaxID=1181502 RepID=A0A806KMK7_9BACT|nr:cellulase [uncultured bacterium contig00010]